MRQVVELRGELVLADQRVGTLETRCRDELSGGEDAREKERTLQRENDTLRQRLQELDAQKGASFKREDGLGRENQRIKVENHALKKENEQVVAQMKAILAEKEKVAHENRQRVEERGEVQRRQAELEQELCAALAEKEHYSGIIELALGGREQRAGPQTEIQRVFADFRDNLSELMAAEGRKARLEGELLALEGQLRSHAKKETTGTVNMVSLRKDVEKMRIELGNVEAAIETFRSRQQSVRDEMECIVMSDRRKNEVALETERSLA